MPSQVYTHPVFIFTANNESCWELHTEQKSSTERWGLESPICSRGVATWLHECHGYPGWKLHTQFAFPTSGRESILDLWFVFHMIYTSGFCSVSFSWTQRDFTQLSSSEGFTLSYGQREIPNICQILWVSHPTHWHKLLGTILQLLWKIMSDLVRLTSSDKTASSTLPKQKND